jgi:hypothetical protein
MERSEALQRRSLGWPEIVIHKFSSECVSTPRALEA